MKTSQVLTKAKALILDPDCYCTEFFQVNKYGKFVRAGEEGIVAFCSRGACLAIINKEATIFSGLSPAEIALDVAAIPILEREHVNAGEGHHESATLNNILGHTFAMEMFDAAIATELEKEG